MRYFIFDSREIYELRIFFTSMWVKYKQGYVFKSNDPMHIPPGITFQHSFFLKTKNFDFAIFLRDAPLARFASGLHFQFKCFCLNSCAVSCIAFVWKSFALEFGFCSVLFYFFLHKKWANWLRCFCDCEITAFWAVFLDVSCAMFCCFICSVLRFLAFNVQLLCCLIFCSAFEHYLFDFLDRIPHCCKFCRAEVCLGVIC